jgi:hypothetical protein
LTKKKAITLSELGRGLGRNPSSISRQLNKAGIKPRKGKYDPAQVSEVMEAAAARNSSVLASDPSTPAHKLKLLQCKRLLMEIQKIEGLTVERSEMLQHVTALCQIIQDAFAQAVALTKVQTGDARMVKIMEGVRNEVLKRIKNEPHSIIYYPVFHREIEESIAAEGAESPDVELVITEGNYLLHPQDSWGGVRELLDESWYVDVDDKVRVKRLIQRRLVLGNAMEEAIAWATGSDEVNAQVIGKTRQFADVIVTVGELAPEAR